MYSGASPLSALYVISRILKYNPIFHREPVKFITPQFTDADMFAT